MQCSFYIRISHICPLSTWIKWVRSMETGPSKQCWDADTNLLGLSLCLLPDGVEVFEQIWPHLLLMTWDKWKHTVIWKFEMPGGFMLSKLGFPRNRGRNSFVQQDVATSNPSQDNLSPHPEKRFQPRSISYLSFLPFQFPQKSNLIRVYVIDCLFLNFYNYNGSHINLGLIDLFWLIILGVFILFKTTK